MGKPGINVRSWVSVATQADKSQRSVFLFLNLGSSFWDRLAIPSLGHTSLLHSLVVKTLMNTQVITNTQRGKLKTYWLEGSL